MKRSLVILVGILCSVAAMSQQFYVGMGNGISVFNGDLSHHSQWYGKSESKHALALQFGSKLSKVWRVQAQLLHTTLAGDDRHAQEQSLINRNLSVATTLNELSITTQFHFFDVLYLNSKYVSPFLEAGFGVFHFDPKADYQGRTYRLQPLSTEGQGLPNSSATPYQLIETDLILGFGISFRLTDHLSASMGSTLRLTKTDYLDDVSGTYYDLRELSKFKGPLAANLAFRTKEINPNCTDEVGGFARGNPTNNDAFVIHQINIVYTFGGKKKPEPVDQ